ncbi:transcriptional activator [Reticulibacter mediterranei]|uniref:Transcriptional activator n=1 Tax=Reticulibacter mediterranei TaxID=2778369 RepID=A0A8J3IM17_9CHLR|nr:AAA family ATPase [Reticulibacter mediterranei]GHO96423.1 transcriptional activator [Reticulibacter mediterranei]
MQDASLQLMIHLLGPPEMQIAGSPFIVHHFKPRALLFYLAATGRPHNRDHLASLLWSETTDSNARHSLRSSIYHLRQAFNTRGIGDVLTGEGDVISLKPPPQMCDVVLFRQLLTEGSESALSRAITLYKGPLLQGFTLAEAPCFEEWRRDEAILLDQSYLMALRRLASWAEARKAWDEAIGYVQRIVQVDRFSEDEQRRLINLYIRTRAIGMALLQYRQFETELSRELGLVPSAEMQTLLNEILMIQRNASISGSAPPRVPTGSQTSPFVGREGLVKQLLDMSQKPLADKGVTLLIQGEDGSGKSRLVSEYIEMLTHASPSWVILQGTCSPFDDLLSYGPFIEAFQCTSLGDLSDLLAESHEKDADAQGHFQWRVLQALHMLSCNVPLLLALDDLQWANSSTLRLFGFLATRIRHLPIMLLGCVHDASAIPALDRLVMLGRRRGDVHVASLSPLSLEAVVDLLHASAVGVSSAALLAQWLHARSGGSPFILLEILTQLRTDGILTLVGEHWSLDMGRWLRWRAARPLPDTTHDLLSWRLALLSSHARTLLEVLAVAELALPFALLYEFPNVQGDQLLPELDDLVHRGLVIESESDRFTLAYRLLRETLVYQLSDVRHRILHCQLVQIIEGCPIWRANIPLRQMARHAVAGEDAERARRYGLRFLDELSLEDANTETVAFLHHLYDLVLATALPNEILHLTHALGTFHQVLGQLDEAAHWHRQNLELAQRIGDLVAQITAYFELAELGLVTNDYSEAITVARAGLVLCEQAVKVLPVALVARGHRMLGAALAMEGSDLLVAESHLQQALAMYEHQEIGKTVLSLGTICSAPGNKRAEAFHQQEPRHGSRRDAYQSDLCATLFELGNVAAQRGELHRALECYQESAGAAASAHSYYFLALAHNNFAYHSLLLGQSETAQCSVEQANTIAEAHDLLGVFLHSFSTQGEIHLYLGNWTEATDAFQQGLMLAEELGNIERQAGYQAGLALVARGQNDLVKARTQLEAALALLIDQGYWHLRTRIQLWLTETLLVCGSIDEAQSYLDAALHTAQRHGRLLQLLQSQRLSAHLLALQGDSQAANVLFAETLEQASSSGFDLEIARTQAAWGETILLDAPTAQALLHEACNVFAAHGARAELKAITALLHA